MDNIFVVIDPGHGGDDPGTVGNGLQEKDLTLQISKYMYERFRSLGIPVAITRDSDETLDSSERVRRILNAFGNKENVVVISNHINSSATPNTAEGAEVIYALRNNDTLAKNILEAFQMEGQPVRRIYQRALPSNPNRDYYFIHRETGITQPVIIEYGFINNLEDITRVRNNYRRYVDAIVDAVIRTFNVETSSDTYTVRPGDTLYSIAKMYNTSVESLKYLNNLTSNLLSIGQVLKVNSNDMGNSDTTYTVKKGDTLYSIAKKYNTTVNNLITLNNLSSDLLSVGQILKIKDNDTNTQNGEYVVKAGDSLWKIAREFSVSVDELKKANNLNSNVIFIGQVLKIPTSRQNQTQAKLVYRVKAGDTLYSIAKYFNTTVEELMKLNELEGDLIVVGQLLLIP